MADSSHRKTRNCYNKQSIDHIVNMVLSGQLRPSYSAILPYASSVFGCTIKQTTAANWFSERNISLVDLKKTLRENSVSPSKKTPSPTRSPLASSPSDRLPNSSLIASKPPSGTHASGSYSNSSLVVPGSSAYPQAPTYNYHHPQSNAFSPIYPNQPYPNQQFPNQSYPNPFPQAPPQGHYPPNSVPINFYAYAPTVMRKPKTNVELGRRIITFVAAELISQRIVSIDSIILHLQTLENNTYSLETIKSTCEKYALTYMLPGVGPTGTTYQQYLGTVYTMFPSIFHINH